MYINYVRFSQTVSYYFAQDIYWCVSLSITIMLRKLRRFLFSLKLCKNKWNIFSDRKQEKNIYEFVKRKQYIFYII